MNKMPKELLTDIAESEKINNIIAELQDIQGLMENSELVGRISKVIVELKN